MAIAASPPMKLSPSSSPTAASSARPPARDLVQLSMFCVSPETLRGLRDAGYRNLATHDLQQFGIFRVTPEYIRELADLGYRDIAPATIVRMKMFGVTPAYVRSANDRA